MKAINQIRRRERSCERDQERNRLFEVLLPKIKDFEVLKRKRKIKEITSYNISSILCNNCLRISNFSWDPCVQSKNKKLYSVIPKLCLWFESLLF